MSRGYGAFMIKADEDEDYVIYEYGSYNLNNDNHRNKEGKMDGFILIAKSCFKEPEIHKKIKRMPNKRKKEVVKRVPISVNYPQMIVAGKIVIKNCTNVWKEIKGIDFIVLHLLFKLFLEYQRESSIPEEIDYHV